MPKRPSGEYVALAVQGIKGILDQELAATWLEVEAKISDEEWPGLGTRIDPHHLSDARRRLVRSSTVLELSATSRGGREVSVIVPFERAQTTAVQRAAARKRLLASRYLGWAQGTPSRPGVIGPAAERVTHASLLASAPHGYRVVNPSGGTVSELMGIKLKGPLDNAAFLTPLDASGLPRPTVAVPIEVKNVRDWLYPSSPEPYQLLAKATALQRAYPNQPIMPVLICRRAHLTLFRMAKDFGFFVVETRRQFVNPTVEADHLQEVRAELGFLDLVATNEADRLIVDRLTKTLPNYAHERASTWAITATSGTATAFSQIATDQHSYRRRNAVHAMRLHARHDGLVRAGGW